MFELVKVLFEKISNKERVHTCVVAKAINNSIIAELLLKLCTKLCSCCTYI